MPIDSRIALGVQPLQLESPVNQLANILQLQGARQQNQIGRLKIDQLQQESLRQNKLLELLTGGADANALRGAGFLQESQDLQKSDAEIGYKRSQTTKNDADARKTELEAGLQKLQIAGQIMNGVRDQATYEVARQRAVEAFGPEAAAKMPAQYNPQMVAQQQQQAMSVQQKLEQEWKAKGYDLDVRKQGEVERNNATQNRISQGQPGVAQGNLGVRKQELAANGAAGGKPPSGYRWKADGQLEPIPGGPADVTNKTGAPTEDERKAAGWVNQAQFAYDNMERVLASDPGAAKPSVAPEVVGRIPLVGSVARNSLNSSSRQQFEQAADSFAEAALRAATGAGVNESEAKQKVRELTPQIGDGKDVIAQKRQAMSMYLESLRSRAGRALPASANRGGATGSYAGGSAVDEALEKYGN